MVDPSRVGNGSVKPWSTLVKPGQPWSILVKLQETRLGPSSWGYLMWRALVGSGQLGSSCLILGVDTRENPVGKNGVMTPTCTTTDTIQMVIIVIVKLKHQGY